MNQPVEYRPVVGNVLGELGTASGTARELIDYETALEGAAQAIGYYAGLIAVEETGAEPDLEAIAGWRADQEAMAARRRALTPQDADEIESIRDDVSDLLAQGDDDDEDDADEDDAGPDDDADDDLD